MCDVFILLYVDGVLSIKIWIIFKNKKSKMCIEHPMISSNVTNTFIFHLLTARPICKWLCLGENIHYLWVLGVSVMKFLGC